ncbi:MAG: hypothetical protein V4498_07625 [candidate division FCPU426 bacterium]
MDLTNTAEALQVGLQVANKDIDRIFSLFEWQQLAMLTILGFISYFSYRASKNDMESSIQKRIEEMKNQIKADARKEREDMTEKFEADLAQIGSRLYFTHANSVINTRNDWAFLSNLRGIQILINKKNRNTKNIDKVNRVAINSKTIFERDPSIKQKIFNDDPSKCQFAEKVLVKLSEDENNSVIGKMLLQIWNDQKLS